MARIQGVPPGKQGFLARTIFGMARKRLGKVPEPMTITAHHSTFFKGYVALEYFLDKSRLVDLRLKMLAQIKVSTLIGCPFWMDIGSALGRAAGVSEEQLRDIHAYRTSAAYSPLEKLVMEYAERMTRTPVEVSNELFEKLRAHFNEAQMVELTATIAWENYRARFDHAFGVESQNFSEGAYCALPERGAASAAGH